ncbi:diacylglycerol kinase [Enterococcus florum]|uniref:Diacylglycerol kinase n=1 Tax=Enterococcus florum TaxID=2480627 RepID=A0A4P5PAA1_9ENTE|nr:diacylglycerol kinase family protein [Enterococcus florum]GCF95017.1 diacylglycerol kinase [Enterococcus florum]
MTYAIFFNPNAGDGEAEKTAQKLKAKLTDNGISAEFLTAPDEKQALEKIKKGIDQYDSLIAIGGDGTLNIAATAFVQKGKTIPFGVIPGGTVNNFAKRYQIPQDEEEAMNVIIAGNTTKVGIGACKERSKAIVSSFAFGTFADISNEVRQNEKQKFGRIVYVFKAIKQLGKNRSYKVHVKTEDFEETIKVWFALITTTKSIGGFNYAQSSPRAFHMSILHNIRLYKLFGLLYFVFTGKLRSSDSLTYLEPVHIQLEPREDAKVVVRIDGDKGPELPIDLEWLDDFIPLYVDEAKEKAARREKNG